MKKHSPLSLLPLLLALLLLLGCAQNVGTPCITHADSDNNGLCDNCTQSVLVSFDFYTINDLHGKFSDTDQNPGVDELTTYLKEAAKNDDNAYFLATGDIWQGSAESNMTYGALMTDWMNQLDFVAMTLGNHEFDWGTQPIADNAQLAEFPFLAINIYDRTTNTLVPYCQSSVMVEADGIQIGIIGAIGDCYSSISSDKVTDIYFKTGSELTALVKAESQKLREQGADFIIYSLHDGYDQNMGGVGTVADNRLRSFYDISLSDGYVDLVFEGHIHKSYVFTDSKGVYHLQGGGENKGITHVTVTFNTANDNSTVTTAEFVSNNRYQNLADDALVNQLLEKYQDQIGGAKEVLGHNDMKRSGDTLRSIMAKLYYETGLKTWGDKYDITLGGGFLSVRSPYDLNAGDVTYAMLHSIFPFDNQIVLCSVKGDSLLKNFINSTNSNYFIYGDYAGKNIDPNGTYYIVVDTYTSQYEPNRLTVLEEYAPDIYGRDLLADYIREGHFTSQSPDGSYTLTSIPEILQLGASLKAGATTDKGYYVKGTVQAVHNSTYGNLTLVDEAGNSLYVYGVYDKSGENRYDAMKNPPKVGDTVVLFGVIQNYVPKNGDAIIEMVSGRVIPE